MELHIERFKTYDIVVLGGGLAGLSCALHLAKNGIGVLLIEKHKYPRHKVCGEYVSNEILPYLNNLGIDPLAHGAVSISKFEISSKKGKSVKTRLPLGGFGMSRYCLDALMFNELKAHADILIDTATDVTFKDDSFTIQTKDKQIIHAKQVIGAFGKRSLLDKTLDRDFIGERTHWMAVKEHYHYDFPSDTVALHNFDGGYCGLSKTESGVVNACYLTSIRSFNSCSGIADFQKKVMSRNPRLEHFFENAQSIFKKPLTISQISFAKKTTVDNHIIMIGDSAGLIHPLCGNGMAMAIHSAKLFSEIYLKESKKPIPVRAKIEQDYNAAWDRAFSSRMRTGAIVQKLLLNNTASNLAYRAATMFPSMVPAVIKKTHGRELV